MGNYLTQCVYLPLEDFDDNIHVYDPENLTQSQKFYKEPKKKRFSRFRFYTVDI